MKNRYGHIASLLLILVLCWIVYLNSLTGAFQYDDHFAVTGNSAVRDLRNAPEIFRLYPGRFILMYSFALNYFLNGNNPTGYHVANLLFHISNALLFYFIVVILLKKSLDPDAAGPAAADRSVPLIAALVFAAHPLMTESVTYIAGRASSLAAVFFLGALFLYLKAYEWTQPGSSEKSISIARVIFYSVSLLVFFLSLWVKESNATLPAILFLCDFLFIERGQWKRMKYSFLKTLPFFIVLFGILLWRKVYLGVVGDPYHVRSFTVNLLTQLQVAVAYLRLIFLPVGQNIDHDVPLSYSLAEAKTLASLALLIFLAMLSVLLIKSNKLASFGIAWFLITLTPTSVIPLWDAMSERWAYLPAAGIVLAVVSLLPYMRGGANTFAGTGKTKVIAAAAAILVFVLGMSTVCRNQVWKSQYTLWKDAAEKSPAKIRPHINLGMAYAEMGDLTEALAELNIALSLDPASPEVNFSLGSLYLRRGQYDDAISILSATLRRFPEASLIPVRLADDFAKAHFNLGVAHFYKGSYDRALAEYHAALALAPYLPWVHSNIGVIYEQRGQFGLALAEYQKELELHPEQQQVRMNIELVVRKIRFQESQNRLEPLDNSAISSYR